MNNQLRKRLALLLLVTIVVCPLSLPSAAKTEAPLFDGPTEFIRQIPLTTNDLAYSPLTGKIYATVPSSAGSGGNTIKSIDPATGVIESSTFVGSEPNKLALSDDGHSMYVSLDGAAAVRRFDAQTNTPGLQFTLGQDPLFGGRFFAGELAVAPANPDVLAVARSRGFGPSGSGVGGRPGGTGDRSVGLERYRRTASPYRPVRPRRSLQLGSREVCLGSTGSVRAIGRGTGPRPEPRK